MKRRLHYLRILAAFALVFVACSESSDVTTTSSLPQPDTTTTTRPATTTTAEKGPCAAVFCVTYHIQPKAIWSDSEPVTSEDFVYTAEVFTGPSAGGLTTTGYHLIESAEAVDDKTVIFGFSEVYGPWRTLFDIVLPAHVGDPLDLSVTASAFRLQEIESDRIVLARNTNFWSDVDPASGSPVGDVTHVEFITIPAVRDRLSAFEDLEVDVIKPNPLDWVVEDLNEMISSNIVVSSGPFWEHIDFNHDDPLLSQRWVREAIAFGIDRDTILNETVRTVGPDTDSLGNSIWMTNADTYVSHYDLGFDPIRSEQILQDHGCTRADDGIYECDGQRMSFAWTTTVGDELRVTAADRIQDSLAQIGVELNIHLRTPSDLFSSEVFFGGPEIWQMINFSWKASADPHLGNSIYYCTGNAPSGFGALNVNRYCNDDVDSMVKSTDSILDSSERADVYNEADRLYLEDLAIIPLYQKPSLLAWNVQLSGPVPNMSRATDMWNLAAWEGPESIVIALGSEPFLLDPIEPWNEDTALVMRSLVSGAFTTTPSLEFVPVLVDSAETYVSNG